MTERTIAPFQISTDEDFRFQYVFANMDMTGRSLRVIVKERATNTTRATLTIGSGLTLTGTDTVTGSVAQATSAVWPRGEYEVDLHDITGGSNTRIVAGRAILDLPGNLVYGVRGNKATVTMVGNQALVTAVGGIGPPGPANSLTIGTVTTLETGQSATAAINGTAPNQTLDLGLPKGNTGAKGDTGDVTPAALAAKTAAEAAADLAAAAAAQTGLDADATAADRIATGLDAAATAADRIQTSADALSTLAAKADTLTSASGAALSAASATAASTLAIEAADDAAAIATALSTASVRNLLCNGNFCVNQRCYVSGALLTAGTFGHDRWKAGASGAAYTFIQGVVDTQITITSGTLIQTIEAGDIDSAVYTVSWSGSATARVGKNGAAPSGAYAASPIVITSVTLGQTLAVEFSTGTLGTAQINAGSVALPFSRRSFAEELRIAMRYFQKTFRYGTAPAQNTGDYSGALLTYAVVANSIPTVQWRLIVPMRTNTQTITFFNPAAANDQWSTGGRSAAATTNPGQTLDTVAVSFTGGAPTIAAGAFTAIHATASAEL